MEFVQLFLRHHFAEKPVVEVQSVGCFLRMWKQALFVDAQTVIFKYFI